MINGRIVYHKGHILELDQEEIRKNSEKIRKKLVV